MEVMGMLGQVRGGNGQSYIYSSKLPWVNPEGVASSLLWSVCHHGGLEMSVTGAFSNIRLD
jgi:hypothetical protein